MIILMVRLSNIATWNSDQSANIANIYNNGSPQTTYTVTPQNWWKLNTDSVYTPSTPNYTTALKLNVSSSDNINFTQGLLNNLSEFSISFWYNRAVANSWPSYSVILTQSGLLDIGQFRYENNNAGIYVGLTTANGTFTIPSTGSGRVYLNEWLFVTVVYDGVNLISYRNGELAPGTNTVAATGNTVTNTNNFKLEPTHGLDYSVSNLAFYNSALTSSQVSTLFNFGTPETAISFSPQAWWKLDDQTAITDSSGNGNTGTNNGATDISSGVAVIPSWKIPSALTIPTINYTTALDFNRSEYDNLNTTPVTDFDTGDVSFSVWVFKDDGSTNGFVFNNSYNSGKAGITVAINDLERVSIKRSTRTHLKSTGYRNFGFTTNKWHQIAFTYDDSTHVLRTFLDGQFKEEWSVPSGTLAASTTVCVGGREPGSGNAALFFDGKISNLTIFNSKLEDSDINTLYNSGQPLSDLSSFTTLATWWKLDNLTTGIQDSAGSINLTNDGATQVTSDVYSGNIPVNGVSTTLPSTALQQSDLQFDSPYSNYSLSFDGTSYIIIGSSTELDNVPSNPHSFSFWFKSSAAGDVISEKRAVNNFLNAQYTIHLTNPDGYVVWYGGASTLTGTQTSTTLIDNQWHHIVCVAESTTVSKIYVDGQLNVTSSANRINSAVMEGTFNIGANYVSSYRYEGNLDETSIFNYSLSEAQVLEIYNNGRPKDLTAFSGTAPISWWRLGENAYFNNNSFVVPNSISGAPNGTGAGTVTTMISADAPGTYANGVGTNLDILDRVGDAPLSTSNSQSYNMIPHDKVPYVPGYVGNQISNTYSMSFNGTDEYFDASTLSVTGDWSVSLWVNSNSTSYQTAVQLSNSATTGTNDSTIFLYYHPGGASAKWGFYDGSSTLIGLTALNTNQWYNLIVTKSGTTYTLFLNGTQENQGTKANINIQDLLIGKRSVNLFYMDGEIDEVAIFDKALTADQIKFDLYKPTAEGTNQTADIANNPNLPNPVAWYRMGD